MDPPISIRESVRMLIGRCVISYFQIGKHVKRTHLLVDQTFLFSFLPLFIFFLMHIMSCSTTATIPASTTI